MKSFRFESGLVLAVISKDPKGSHGLVIVATPVDWKEVSSQFDRVLGSRSVSDVILKAVVSSDATLGLRSWLASRNAALSGEQTLSVGENRALRFYEESGRLSIETGPKESKPVAVKPAIVRESTGKDVVSVLIVDDSKSMRMVLRKILESSPKFKVIGEAGLPSEALKFLEKHRPDVITLDIQMPEMSGVELFKIINQRFGIPAVMVSALGKNEGHEVIDALDAGAFDYFQKPEASAIEAQAPVLHEKVIQASLSATRKRRPGGVRRKSAGQAVDGSQLAKIDLLAVGASTGGTEAIRLFFELLPADIPPTVVVQHIPPFFSAAFAERLNSLCKFEVREARDGDEIKKGLALVAPGGFHLEVEKSGGKLIAKLTEDPLVNRFRPSVDVMYKSILRVFSKDASRVVGVILTGMGNDGAKGLLALRKAGARTIGQDEESSVVYGMPRAAAEIGACEEVAALEDIATVLTKERRRLTA